MIDGAVRGHTIEEATGLGRIGKVSQWELPHTAISFVQKEMGFAVARKHATKLRFSVLAMLGLAAVAMMLALAWQLLSILAAIHALSSQRVERWLFFAEAQHVSPSSTARPRPMLAESVQWFYDWFAIENIAPGVQAIGEPRFHQINWNYLIEGRHTALLFDTGPGVRDISEVVRSLTKLPLIVLPSHLHFDHSGNLHRFQNIALPDLPVLRACMRDGMLHATDDLFRGFLEGMVWKPVKISELVANWQVH